MSSQISRRSFLKLLSTLPLISVLNKPGYFSEVRGSLAEKDQPAQNVLILIFDTLSAKHISLHGYDRETMPNLSRFADRATVYHAHYAPGNFTTPSTASLLTGTYPWSHRAFHVWGTVAESHTEKNLFRQFAPEIYNRVAYTHNLLVTQLLYQFREDLDLFKKTRELSLIDAQVSDLMFPNDYHVAYLGESQILRPFYPLKPSSLFMSMFDTLRRFALKRRLPEEYAALFPRGLPNHKYQFFILEHAIDWIETFLDSSPQPFLGYFHLWPPHNPYNPRREFIGLFDDGWAPVAKPPHFFSDGHSDRFLNQKRREYDEYIAYVDAEFGRLYDFMVQTGVLDNTYVVFTSDHGEMFERGIFEHDTPVLYEPVIRVPLLISKPGQQQRQDVYSPSSGIDLLPTLLQATGHTIPDWWEGKILPTFDGQEAHQDRSIFVVEAKSNAKQGPLTKGTVAMIKGRYKLIHYFGYDGYENEHELYDLVNDPEEMEDLYSSQKSIAVELQTELEKKLQEVSQTPT